MNDDEDFEGEGWDDLLRRIGENDPNTDAFDVTEVKAIDIDYIFRTAAEDWEDIGRDISHNTYLKRLAIYNENDHKMSYFFRGLTRSNSIEEVHLDDNGLSAAGVRSMVPLLQNASNLTRLDLDGNNIQSEGFNMLLRVLRDSPIERLDCDGCDIASIEIDTEHIPKHLRTLSLSENNISSNGCRELAKLLQGGDATLRYLLLDNNKIDDEGVEILVNALKTNTSLKTLSLEGNNKISKQGQLMLLKLVGDISSIEATLQSNHTLNKIKITSETSGTEDFPFETSDKDARIISEAIDLVLDSTPSFVKRNRRFEREKLLHTQLHSATRAKLGRLQGVTSSVFSEIDPLHLPEVLALVGRRHGQGELYVTLKSSIAGVISTVNRKECLKQLIAEQRAIMVECRTKIEAAKAEIAAIEAAEVHGMDAVSDEFRSNKRRRS